MRRLQAGLLIFVVGACDEATAPPVDDNPVPGQITLPSAAPGDAFGSAVAASATTVVVGSPGSDGDGEVPLQDAGEVIVYARSGNQLTLQTRLTAPSPRAGDRFGATVALDGDFLIVGAPGTDAILDREGAIYLFARQGGAWTLITPAGP